MASPIRDASPPAPGVNHAIEFLAPASLLYAVSVILTAARMYCRARPQLALRWNDYALLLANVSALFNLTTSCRRCRHSNTNRVINRTQGVGSAWFAIVVWLYGRGRGVDDYPTDPAATAAIGPWSVAAGLLWIWATNLVRASMGLMLLRLKDERRWKWPLRILVLVQVCLIIVATTVQLQICRPLSSVWNPTPDMKCISKSVMVTYATVYNGKGPSPTTRVGLRHINHPHLLFSFQHCERFHLGPNATQLHP